MKKLSLLLIPVLLACTLTRQVRHEPPPTVEPTETTLPSPAPTPAVCRVKTGLQDGALNLRTCGGVHCTVAGVLYEGETLTYIEGTSEWLYVLTARGYGWVNKNFTNCEVTK